MNLETAVARPLVLVLLRQLVADMVDQSGKQRFVNRHEQCVELFIGPTRVRFGFRLALAAEQIANLTMHGLPFLHAQERHVVIAADLAQLPIFRRLVPVTPLLPELEQDRKSTTSELQSLMRISYAVFCLKKKNRNTRRKPT